MVLAGFFTFTTKESPFFMDLQSAMRSDDARWRRAALQSLATMPDISDDENSPNFASINAPVVNLGDAQRAMNFHCISFKAGQPSSSASGFSTNVDMVANSLIRNLDFRCCRFAFRCEFNRRKQDQKCVQGIVKSTQSEVSDPDLWLLLTT